MRKLLLIVALATAMTGFFVSCQDDKHDEKASDEIWDLLLASRKSQLSFSDYADSLYDAKVVGEAGRDYI